MLDENLPTFRFKPSSDDPLSTILYFTQNGSEPSPEYLLRRPDPALPASRNKYGVALCDPYNHNVIYGEVTVEPEWALPTLSAAEIRAQAQSGAPPAPAAAIIPDSFSIQLYNPDQTFTVKMMTGTWNKSDSWEFEIPVQTFKTPTTSELDREQQDNPLAAAGLIPRIMFRWKKEGKLSKDMACYMSGTNTAGRKSKEPDITVAMYKGSSQKSIMTLYQPNLHRVEVEDRKGLELVLLLGAEVIKDLYLSPKPGIFNVSASDPAPISGKRKNSRPNIVAAATTPTPGTKTPPAAMSGALNNTPPAKTTTPTSSKPQHQPSPPHATATNAIPPPPPGGSKPGVTFTSTPTASIEAETRRLQELVEREQREREKAERAEQKRIKKMLEEEEKARLKKEAEVAKETERLRKKYGVEGQDLPSDRPSLPPRPQVSPVAAQQPYFPPPPPPQQQPSWLGAQAPALPPRPLSAGPPANGPGNEQGGPFHCNKLNVLWKGAAGQLQQLQHQVENRMSPELQAKLNQTLPHRPKKDGEDSGGRRRVQRKRSSGF